MTILSDADRLSMLTDMVAARTQAGRLWNLQRQGRVGTLAPIDGHEATFVGAVHALDPEVDWFVPQYREALALMRYGPEVLDRYLLYNLGHPAGGFIPEPIRALPCQISLATQIPHAVGLAWGMTLRDDPGVALVSFGDGSSSEGDFYEAGNLAGVLKTPVIFLCVNNQWAISTPSRKQTAADSYAAKAAAFGFPGVTVDGTDPEAVHLAVSEARDRARNGGGPTLIEASLYRLGPHTTADDPTLYVPPEDLVAAQDNDPVTKYRELLSSEGLWDDAHHAEVAQSALDLFDASFERACQWPLSPDAVLDHCYAEDTPRMARQRAALLASGGHHG
ncbi:MAG TPA: pyruvate dehydrogenase (acetyl-transferring) E1 component subunit alpha [Acidimicrobiia bacterium]|nr:pyruvate dehydrogenase (acetyl-transferring) E1 component subunit alpha [Actinomycetota bacterium]HIG24546.1 pyruvate dehydrogenase (acetyl-transferring) E1 component subunit alpha [Acidimicrobiia bacterium]HIL47378.1 pyruvate dehydrogenase (acetyl-transferring) E1 component subunit alpha [Acidimicrobiia bacterium]